MNDLELIFSMLGVIGAEIVARAAANQQSWKLIRSAIACTMSGIAIGSVTASAEAGTSIAPVISRSAGASWKMRSTSSIGQCARSPDVT